MATIYVRNLDEKTPLKELKLQLESRFSQYGELMGISAKKSLKMRGQAFIDFKDPQQAANAIEALNGTELFGRSLVVQQAKGDSDAVHLLKTGAPKKRKLPEHGSESKRPKLAPNKILFLENLPSTITVEQLESHFKPMPGFVEARAFAVKGVGFIEFDSIENASKAHNDFDFNGTEVSVSYAK